MGSIMKHLKSGSFSLVVVAVVGVPSFCYLFTKALVDNLYFIFYILAGVQPTPLHESHKMGFQRFPDG
jgi:hypothetical protein